MKNYLKATFLNFIALSLLSSILNEAITFANGWQTIALTALVLTFLNKAVKPLIKLLFLPINLLTLGMFRWLINVLILFLLTLIIPGFKIHSFSFSGFTYQGFSLPAMEINFFFSLVICSFFLSIFNSFFSWLIA